MRKRKKKDDPLFTREELEELKAILFAMTLNGDCVTAPLYQKYMGSYSNFMAMRRSRENEKAIEKKEEEEAIELLRGKGYIVKKDQSTDETVERVEYIGRDGSPTRESGSRQEGSIPSSSTSRKEERKEMRHASLFSSMEK